MIVFFYSLAFPSSSILFVHSYIMYSTMPCHYFSYFNTNRYSIIMLYAGCKYCSLQHTASSKSSSTDYYIMWIGLFFSYTLSSFCQLKLNICSDDIVPLLLFFYLQRYIEKEFGPDQKLPWLRYHIGKGFAGKFYTKLLLDWYPFSTSPLPCSTSKTNSNVEFESR